MVTWLCCVDYLRLEAFPWASRINTPACEPQNPATSGMLHFAVYSEASSNVLQVSSSTVARNKNVGLEDSASSLIVYFWSR